MTRPSVLRTTSDLQTLRALVSVLSQLASEAPDLMVVRGSFAVFAHAPTLARIPNDLDIYWLGTSEAVVALFEILHEKPQFSVVEIRPVALRDNTIVSLHRGDVVVWLEERQEGGPPTHRVWVDISTRRRTVRSVGIDLELAPGVRSNARVMTLSEVLAEKLFIFLDAVRGGRNSLRWTELFDMLVLLRGASALGALQPHQLRDECVRYASDYSFDMPTGFPDAPTAWRAPWYRQVGPIARAAPNLARACQIARAFWAPVIDPHHTDGALLRWDAVDLKWIAP